MCNTRKCAAVDDLPVLTSFLGLRRHAFRGGGWPVGGASSTACYEGSVLTEPNYSTTSDAATAVPTSSGSSSSKGSTSANSTCTKTWQPGDNANRALHKSLQQCLQKHGIQGSWDSASSRQHEEDWVQSSVEPKLAALEGEGLQPGQVARLLRASHSGLLLCEPTSFMQSLLALKHLLRHISSHQLAVASPEGEEGGSGLTAAGLLMARSPACLAQYLAGPSGAIAAAQDWLQRALAIEEAGFASMVITRPCLLNAGIGPQVLEVLGVLDSLSAHPGWGRKLLAADPLVAAAKPAVAQANLQALLAAGFTPQEICETLEQAANLLILQLSGPAYVQKFEWLRCCAPAGWSLVGLLKEPRYLTGELRRVAARVAFMREQGLPDPPAPDRTLVLSTSEVFCKAVSRQLGWELASQQLRAWEVRWLGTAEGHRWGCIPT
ncbi:hypothetical protein N2152v2_006203 [Parachlorella kessleri]